VVKLRTNELRTVERLNEDGTTTLFLGFSGLRKGDRFRLSGDGQVTAGAPIITAESDPYPSEGNPTILAIIGYVHETSALASAKT
jgi:hypothetical protein